MQALNLASQQTVLPAARCATQPCPRTQPQALGSVSGMSTQALPTQARGQQRLACRAIVTDQTVPEGHKGLHGMLYGEGGAEVHDFAREYVFREVRPPSGDTSWSLVTFVLC